MDDAADASGSSGESGASRSGPRLPPELEATLVERVREGDGEALVRLFRAYRQPLCGFAERLLGAPSEAEDAVLDVFARVWETRAEWRVRRTARAYFYQAVRNRAISMLRHRRVMEETHVRLSSEAARPGLGAPPPSPHQALAARELGATIRAEIARLPDRCRQAFTLHRWDGLSYAEIAEVMGISPRTVENQIARSLQLLREALRERLEEDPDPPAPDDGGPD